MKIVIIFALALCGVQSVDNSASEISDRNKIKRHLIGGDWSWNYPWNYQPEAYEGYFYPSPQPLPEVNIGTEVHLSTINLTPVILYDERKQTIKVKFAAEIESSKSFVILPFEEVISAPISKDGIQTISFDLVLNHNYRNGLSISPKVSIKTNKIEDLKMNTKIEGNDKLDRNEEHDEYEEDESRELEFEKDEVKNGTSNNYFPKIDVRGPDFISNQTNV